MKVIRVWVLTFYFRDKIEETFSQKTNGFLLFTVHKNDFWTEKFNTYQRGTRTILEEKRLKFSKQLITTVSRTYTETSLSCPVVCVVVVMVGTRLRGTDRNEVSNGIQNREYYTRTILCQACLHYIIVIIVA